MNLFSPNKFPLAVWNAITDIGRSSAIAQEISSPSKESRRWVVIYNVARACTNSRGRVDTQHPFSLEMDRFKYCLFILEINNDIINNAAESGIGIDEIKGISAKGANSKEEIYDVLNEWEIVAEKFCPPWHCGLPV